MGSGIAATFASAGIPVTILETSADALARGVAKIRRGWETSVQKGRMTKAELEHKCGLISTSTDVNSIVSVDLVIEAVFEELSLKQAVFKMLDGVVRRGAILASNTSTLDLDRIAAATERPEDVVGLHFFSPANVMRLLEVVRGRHTGLDVLSTAMHLARKLSKVPVVSRVGDGFIGNRMIEQYLRQAAFLLEEGALPQQVDAALETFGMAMGPFKMSDLAGNDIGWQVRRQRRLANPGYLYPALPDKICELGKFGQKSGCGWYVYREGDRSPHVDPTIEAIIAEHSASFGMVRREIQDREIVERCIFALVNEGARVLEEGVAQSASDIDTVYLNGYGFPRRRGGPMFYADSVGLNYVIPRIEAFSKIPHGDSLFWQPAPLLARLAAEGRTFT
jgi:3-hydroxyacyl-CoA dehydrogenase